MGTAAQIAWAKATLGISLLISGVIALGFFIHKNRKDALNQSLDHEKFIKGEIKALEEATKASKEFLDISGIDKATAQMNPIKKEMDLEIKVPEVVDIKVRYNVIEAAAFDSAEARSRILEYQALRGPQASITPAIRSTQTDITPAVDYNSLTGTNFSASNIQPQKEDSKETNNILKEMLTLQKEQAGRPDLAQAILSASSGRSIR
jgi:hypothetical protein